MEPLFSSLLDLLRELDSSGIPLTIGGGFGLYLKRLHLERTGERTLFSILPAIRSTNDIDLFLRAEVLSDLARTREVADAIERLGYTPVEEAKFLQRKRPVATAGMAQEVKIDVLVGPLGQYRDRLKVSAPGCGPEERSSFTLTRSRRPSISRISRSVCRSKASRRTGPRFEARSTCPRHSRTS